MGMKNICKGCTEDVHISEVQLKRILDSLSLKSEHMVTDEYYNERVSICMACPSLQYGTTCAHCGCIVQIRAKMKDKGCPFPGLTKWSIT
ncbi:hypothetical protein J2T13_000067 [Paenibacillus sp. DS2015]|uniref:DUF6171 family protein n=1 Tax=Paenibacillus sp. DS2015 TaxID=3373917 RepID=UPI003D22A613